MIFSYSVHPSVLTANLKIKARQGFGSGLILTGSGSNLSRQTGSVPTSQDKPDPDPDPDTSVLKIFHLFYDEF